MMFWIVVERTGNGEKEGGFLYLDLDSIAQLKS